MEIKLSNSESEEYFYNALCNGLSYVQGHGLELAYDESEYTASRVRLGQDNPAMFSICYEDILMQMLKDGYSLTLEDVEGDGENSATITLADVHQRVTLVDAQNLMDMHNGDDDACTADVIIQTVFFNEVIFG